MAALFAVIPARAQDALEVRRVGLDSLVNFIRKEFNPRTFYVRDAQEQSDFTVISTRAAFMDSVRKELQDKGYVLAEYDGGLYILHGKTLQASLPAGYFVTGSVSDDKGLQQYLAEQNVIVTFQNKVYEVGERDNSRSGKAYVSGNVRDVSTGEPLVGVSVYDNESGTYAVTDAAGFYRILLPTGDNTLNFSGYSLEDMHLTLKVWNDGGLDVVMKEKVTALKGAVVSADAVSHHRDASIGIEKVRMDVAKKVPTAFGETDIIKVVMTLPGVKSVGEASSGFNVRGGSTDQNLVLFNDGIIFNPSHMFGIFSAFNSDVVNEIELYKSSIPAQFGGRISSVLDVRSKEGNSKKVTGSLGLGLLTSRLHLEGPIVKDRTTFILGARTTYSNWLLNLMPDNSNYHGGLASFSDVNLGVSHKVNAKNSLHLNGYWSRDRFSFSSDTTFRYSSINASASWRSSFNDKHNMVLSAGYNQYSADFDNDFNPMSGYRINTGIRQLFTKLNFHSSIAEKHKLTYGMDAIYHFLNPGKLSPLQNQSFIKSRELKQENGIEPAVFVSDSWDVNDKLVLDGGIRWSGFLAMNPSKFYTAPEFRLSGKYSLRNNFSVKAGFNSMNQYIHLLSNTSSISPIDTWKLCDTDIRPQTGWQAASGLYWTIADGKVDLTLEGYYKHMDHYLDYKSGAVLMMNENLADDLVETKGKAYGVEFMAKKTLGKLTGWLSYTYSRAFLREDSGRGVGGINGGEWYRAAYDKPHDVKLVGNYKFTHRYSLSFNLDYSTGRPVTIPVGQYVIGGATRLAYSERNGYRIPDYFRLDLAMNIDPGHYLKQFSHMSVTFGVYNVTGRKNAYSVFYSTNDKGGVNGHMLSIFACPIPYVNLNMLF